MSGINKAIIVGRLGTDPEVRQTGAGGTVASLSVATSERWTGKDGTPQERTEWHRIVVWGKLAELCGRYLSKGRQVYVEGRLQTRQWEDQQGQKRYTTEIVATAVQFLDAGKSVDDRASSQGPSNFQDFGPEPSFDANEDIPF